MRARVALLLIVVLISLGVTSSAEVAAALAEAAELEGPAARDEPARVEDLVIDVHTHVFNAWDLPLVPFMKKHNVLLGAVAPFLVKHLRRQAPRYRGAPAEPCLVDRRDSPGPETSCSEAEAAELFHELLDQEPELEEMVSQERTRGAGFVDLLEAGPRLVRFVTAFYDSRVHQARTLVSLYPEVDLFVPAMVDMDGWPGEDTKLLPLADRLAAIGEVMTELNGDYPGILHPYIAFNPLHGIEGLPEYMEGYHELIAGALRNDGFLGVKVYPSFGYLPLGNARVPAEEGHRPPHAERVDAELEWLYAFAQENGIPIMAHCSAEGAELSKIHSETYGHPRNWEPVLERYPRLRVSLGHFGKPSELIHAATAGDNWPRIVNDMVGRYPNLYADLALDGVPREEDFVKMLTALRSLMDGQPRLRQRLMYGTDWFMLLLDPGAEEYYRRYDAEFTDEVLGPGTRRAFFGANAVEFLGLDDPRTRERLRSYYASRSLAAPRWLVDEQGPTSRRQSRGGASGTAAGRCGPPA